MRMLITNDDGINAKGLEVLKAIALRSSPSPLTGEGGAGVVHAHSTRVPGRSTSRSEVRRSGVLTTLDG